MKILNAIIKFFTQLFKSENLVYILLVGLMVLSELQRQRISTTEKIINQMYGMHSFDVSTIPNGLVIYKSGLSSSYNPKIVGDSTMKFDFFVVGVWDTSNDVVFELIVPKFAYNRFIIGYYIRETERNNNSAPPTKEKPEPSEYKQMVNLTENEENKNI